MLKISMTSQQTEVPYPPASDLKAIFHWTTSAERLDRMLSKHKITQKLSESLYVVFL